MWQGTYYHEHPGLVANPCLLKDLRGAGGAGAEEVYREPTEDHAAEMISSGVLCRNDI